MQLSVIISDIVVLAISAVMLVISIDRLKDSRYQKPAFKAMLIGMVLSIVAFFTPEFIFPFQAIAVIFMIYTDFSGGAGLLAFYSAVSMIAYNDGSVYFFYCFITGLFLLQFYKDPEKSYTFKKPLFLYSIYSILIYMAFMIKFSVKLTPESIIGPVCGLFVNILVIIIVLPKIGHEVLFALEEKYAAVVDPEYELMITLKKENNLEYKRALHSGYLSDRLAETIGVDRRMARACAYYHRIGGLLETEAPAAERTATLIAEHEFPDDMQKSINVYTGFERGRYSKENAITMFSDELIKSILRLNMERPGEKINYDALINLVCERVSDRPQIVESDLSRRDLRIIKQRLKEEKLYYDFLR